MSPPAFRVLGVVGGGSVAVGDAHGDGDARGDGEAHRRARCQLRRPRVALADRGVRHHSSGLIPPVFSVLGGCGVAVSGVAVVGLSVDRGVADRC